MARTSQYQIISWYYRCSIKGYETMAQPLTNLLKKGNFQWALISKMAFHQLKTSIIFTLVFILPDFSQPFTLENDVFGIEIGAILTQNHHPITYFLEKLFVDMQE